MPENQHPENDPFADLYSRLPDPRTGARSAPAEGEGTAPSRRAAREARRAQTGPTDTTPDTPEPTGSRSPGDDAVAPATTDVVASDVAPAPDAGSADVAAPAPAPRSTSDDAYGDPTSAPSRASAPSSPRDQPGPRRTGAPAGSARASDAPRVADAARTGTVSASDAPPSARTAQPAREPALVGAGATAMSAASNAPAPGSLEDLFTGGTATQETGSTAPRPPKRRRRVGGWIALAVVLVLLGGLAVGGLVVWNTYGDRIQAFLGNEEPIDYEAGQATGEARVTIVSGDTGASVSPKLFDAGVTKASNSLYSYMVDNSVAFTFQPGVYKLQQQMTSEAVLAALRDPASRLDYSVQLREGLTLQQSLDLISEQLSIPRADLDAATADPSQYGVPASTLEGWIFPATYDFDEGVTAQQVIERMVQRTVQSLDAAGVPESDRERILIVASIIEREARNPDDFYKVSRVIENRLQPSNQETFGKLEMDSTVQYGADELGSGSVSTSTEARNNDNPWNTYIYPGLPVGPISNPGDLAIDAAMKPADGPWLYFVTVNLDTGETVFTSTYSEHQQAVAQWQAWCAANPDGGC